MPDAPLHRADLEADPVDQFRAWYLDRGEEEEGHRDAIALATASASGAPSVRLVLLRAFDHEGFRFFTSHDSPKARDLARNPRAAFVWYDHGNGRQVRVEGGVARLSPEASDAYWRERPRGRRLSAFVSRQSEPVEGRAVMEAAAGEAAERFGEGEIPRPPHWGGYVLRPDRFEFWQREEDRLHDRFEYARQEDGWRITRLWP